MILWCQVKKRRTWNDKRRVYFIWIKTFSVSNKLQLLLGFVKSTNDQEVARMETVPYDTK
jgi:hypothetical protein